MLFSCLGLQSGQGALLLNIITKYSYGKTCFFVSQLILTCMVDPAITFWQLTSFPFLTLLDHIRHGAKQVILWWSPLSLAQGYVLDLKSTQEKENSWIIDISFPTLKCENDVAGLLTALKLQVLTCHMKRSGWKKSFKDFWDFLVNIKKFYLDIVLPWFRFSINCWWQIWRMVNNRALRRSTHSLHLSSYIC
jgi:hypothetical protein